MESKTKELKEKELKDRIKDFELACPRSNFAWKSFAHFFEGSSSFKQGSPIAKERIESEIIKLNEIKTEIEKEIEEWKISNGGPKKEFSKFSNLKAHLDIIETSLALNFEFEKVRKIRYPLEGEEGEIFRNNSELNEQQIQNNKDKSLQSSFYQSFNNYFSSSNISNKTLELTFGSTISAIILFFLGLVKKIFIFLLSKLFPSKKENKKNV